MKKQKLIEEVEKLEKVSRKNFIENWRSDSMYLGEMIAYRKVLALLKQK